MKLPWPASHCGYGQRFLWLPGNRYRYFPGLGGMIRTERHIGPERPSIMYLPERQSAEEAKELGIVTKLVDPTEIDDAIKELVPQASSIARAARNSAKYDN